MSLCNMLINKGEVLKNIIYRYMQVNGISLTALAKKAGYDQSTPYKHFEKDDLPDYVLIRWGKAMNYDMTKDFPDLLESMDMVSEPPIEMSYAKKENDLEKQIDHWRNQYISILQRYNQLLEGKLCEELNR
jgi:AcrR family transcriptional regulator